MRRQYLLGVIAFSLVLFAPVFAKDADEKSYYVSPADLRLAQILPSPPAADSELQKQDLEALLAVQAARTLVQIERARGDAEYSIFRFSEVFGSKFAPENLPVTVEFFRKISNDSRLLLIAGKDGWKRPRPFVFSDAIKPIGELPTSSSYPSGHTAYGQLVGIVLADMVPEKRDALFARSREYGRNRIVLGVHYPSDVEGGRLAATAIAAMMMRNPAFQKDLAAAKLELRKVLGYE